jgi:predicted  nucleic acid-binding Zn-ribbon protein
MYVALGFCLAGLLAVALVPSIWRRAVRLTRRAVEATTPMTHADVRAEIAALRASHAVEYRRLESGLERLQQQATANRIARDRAEALSGDLRKEFISREQALADAMSREADLRREIQENQETIARSGARIRDLERLLKRLMSAQAGETPDAVAGSASLGEPGEAVVPADAAEQSAAAPAGAQDDDALGRASHAMRVTALETEIAALRRRLKRSEERNARTSDEETGEDGGGDETERAATQLTRQELRARDDRLFEMESKLIAARAEITRLSVLAEGTGSDGEAPAAEAARLAAENERLRGELGANADFLALRSELADLASAVVASLGTEEDLEPIAAAGQDGADTPGVPDTVTQSLAARIRAARGRIGAGTPETARNGTPESGKGGASTPPILPGPARASSRGKRKAGG